MENTTFDLVVIGAGPGGYVAAIRAAQLGMRVACVEKEKTLGGTCLNVGCIPSKALLESSELYAKAQHQFAAHGIQASGLALDLKTMLSRKTQIVETLTKGVEWLFKKNKITWIKGAGRLLKAGQVEVTAADGAVTQLTTRNILIATGSQPVTIPGVTFDEERIVSSTEALSFPEVPARLAVIGGGVIGLELGSVWARLGSEVTVIEYLPNILAGMDLELAVTAQKLFEKQGMKFICGARVLGAHSDKKGVRIEYEKAGTTSTLEADRVLVAVGRKPYTEALGLEALGLALDGKGRIAVDGHYQTAIPTVYAVGDVIAGPMLAHKAEEEGVAAVQHMAGKAGHVCYEAIPGIVYTHPEVASVGQTEEQLKAAGIPYRKGAFPFAPNARAKALMETDGFVKILAHAETDRLLGAHIIGARAGDLIAELALAMEFKASSEDIAISVHAHPTLAEIVKEAALGLHGRALHM